MIAATTDIADIAQRIRAERDFLLLTHISPDGDTLGSALALCALLRAQGKRARVVCADAVPERYAFLPGAADVLPPACLVEDAKRCCVVSIDASDRERLGDSVALLDAAPLTICIDHHHTNVGFAQYNAVDADAAATGELICALVEALGWAWTRDAAVCAYTAISTDSGNFSFESTRPRTLRCAATLLEAGIRVQELTRSLYSEKREAHVRLLGAAIASLTLRDGIACMTLTEADLRACGALDSDCDGIVNVGLDIRGVRLAALLRESAQGIKVSLRSLPPVDVGTLAFTLGGGGHARAAGCTLSGTIEAARERIVRLFEEARGKAGDGDV